ncbi:MAG TPA: hypothetical protein VIP70_04360 [Nitrososphaeraceae archaeon]
MTMTVEGKEEKEDILAQEIQSWKGFEYAIREENSSLFNKMLTECQNNEEEYSKAASATIEVGESYSVESIFIALIFQ